MDSTHLKLRLITIILCAWVMCLFLIPTPIKAQEVTDRFPFMKRVRQLIFEGARSGEGYFSSDKSEMVFQSERESGNPFYQIYSINLTDGHVNLVSTGIGKTTCAFFRPNSDQILFSSTHLDKKAKKKQQLELEFRASGKQRRYSWDYDEHTDIFVRNVNSGSLDQLTNANGYDAEASYSPDGKKIVFCSTRNPYLKPEEFTEKELKLLETDKSYFGEIFIMDADGSNQIQLTHTAGYDGGPFFSPDGKRIIWRRFDETGVNADIYTMNLDGSDKKKLTDFRSMSWAPYFHPSGEYVIFASNKFGFSNFELFIVDVKGTKDPIRVTNANGFDGLPVFSPDGNSISWTSNRTSDGKSQIFLAQWDHEKACAALAQSPDRNITSNEILERDLKTTISTLASDAFEGRQAGTKGAKLAADYIEKRLKSAGVVPVKEDSFYISYSFTRGAEIDNKLTQFSITDPDSSSQVMEIGKDFMPLSFSSSGSVSGEVIFGGYGLALPAEGGITLDPFGGADITGKIVLLLRYVPEGVSSERRAELNRYAGLRYKALIARQRGAKAILVVTGPNSPGAGKLISLSEDSSTSGSGIIAASITLDAANQLLKNSQKSLKELQAGLDNENPHASNGFALPKISVDLSIKLNRKEFVDGNLVGAITPDNKPLDPTAEVILLGAHYDHLGIGKSGGSRQTSNEEGQIHNGADDNASGVALLLEIADYFSDPKNKNKLQRPLVLAFWGGEEIGLLGSAKFSESPPIPWENMSGYLNFDMVGRLRDYKLVLQGLGSSGDWKKYIEKSNVVTGFDLNLQDDPYLPTDTTSIYPNGVPVLSFFTGSHEDYHRPSDDSDKINFIGLKDITEFGLRISMALSSAEKKLSYLEYDDPNKGNSNRDTLRIYLGTIPDYASEIKGLKLTGVSSSGPADLAGIKGGDVIVELGGQKIENIYDYTYAIDSLSVDKPTQIKIIRGEERLELEIIPKAR